MKLALLSPEPDDPPDERATRDALDAETVLQADEAAADLDRPAEDYLHLPYASLDRIVGGIVPGDLHYVCAFSGSGKTTLLMNVADLLLQRGQRVYYMGLESQPKALRTKLACLRVGVHDGDVLLGAAKAWGDWPQWREKLLDEFHRQTIGIGENAIVFDGQSCIDAPAFAAACTKAAHFGADVLIVDHIDHVTLGESRSMWEESVRVNRMALELAHRHQLRLLIASQCNNEGVRASTMGQYAPPMPHHVKMGNHKREVASVMLGLFRPQRPGATREEMQSVRTGNESATGMLEPNTMGVVCMKHRAYGSREGQRCNLRIERGKVTDIPLYVADEPRERYGT